MLLGTQHTIAKRRRQLSDTDTTKAAITEQAGESDLKADPTWHCLSPSMVGLQAAASEQQHATLCNAASAQSTEAARNGSLPQEASCDHTRPRGVTFRPAPACNFADNKHASVKSLPLRRQAAQQADRRQPCAGSHLITPRARTPRSS
jgi:hypothetical protein